MKDPSPPHKTTVLCRKKRYLVPRDIAVDPQNDNRVYVN